MYTLSEALSTLYSTTSLRVTNRRTPCVPRGAADRKGSGIYLPKEAIDTTTPTEKFMLTIFGAVAELEREYILQRQQEGIAIAKAQGVYKGRKPIQRSNFNQRTAQAGEAGGGGGAVQLYRQSAPVFWRDAGLPGCGADLCAYAPLPVSYCSSRRNIRLDRLATPQVASPAPATTAQAGRP